jgi:ribosomal protein L35
MWRWCAARAIAAAAGAGARTTTATAAVPAASISSLASVATTTGPSGPSSLARALQQQQQQQQQLRGFFRTPGGALSAVGVGGTHPLAAATAATATTSAAAAIHTSALQQQHPLLLAARATGLPSWRRHQQQQPQHQNQHQKRTLLGAPAPKTKKTANKNYQDHNTRRPERTKPRTPSAARRRIIVAADGSMWRTQAGRRHGRSPKSGGRLRALKGLAPVVPSLARKLRKLGCDRSWWYCHKKA